MPISKGLAESVDGMDALRARPKWPMPKSTVKFEQPMATPATTVVAGGAPDRACGGSRWKAPVTPPKQSAPAPPEKRSLEKALPGTGSSSSKRGHVHNASQGRRELFFETCNVTVTAEKAKTAQAEAELLSEQAKTAQAEAELFRLRCKVDKLSEELAVAKSQLDVPLQRQVEELTAALEGSKAIANNACVHATQYKVASERMAAQCNQQLEIAKQSRAQLEEQLQGIKRSAAAEIEMYKNKIREVQERRIEDGERQQKRLMEFVSRKDIQIAGLTKRLADQWEEHEADRDKAAKLTTTVKSYEKKVLEWHKQMRSLEAKNAELYKELVAAKKKSKSRGAQDMSEEMADFDNYMRNEKAWLRTKGIEGKVLSTKMFEKVGVGKCSRQRGSAIKIV